jgi:2-oxoisovalerate dehydrogenase E1 component
MARNPEIFVLGEGIGARGGNFGTTTGLFAKYGAVRLCDTPICERGFVGLGCGAAMTGTRPVIDFMFVDFLHDAFGEIVNQIAKIQYMSSAGCACPSCCGAALGSVTARPRIILAVIMRSIVTSRDCGSWCPPLPTMPRD